MACSAGNPGMTSKFQRQHLIQRILSEQTVENQVQLVDLLSQESIEATQATVSRDLEELGAVKMRVGCKTVYAIPELTAERVVPVETLRRVCSEWVVQVSQSNNIVVLTTPPGSAHVVASAIDRSGIEGVIGTIAGDDTILVIASEETGGNEIASNLQYLSGL